MSLRSGPILFFLNLFFIVPGWADETSPPRASSQASPQAAPQAIKEESGEDDFSTEEIDAPPPPSSPKPNSKQQNSPSEAEGTRARDRFQVPETHRSAYTYKGRPLEIDPD